MKQTKREKRPNLPVRCKHKRKQSYRKLYSPGLEKWAGLMTTSTFPVSPVTDVPFGKNIIQ